MMLHNCKNLELNAKVSYLHTVKHLCDFGGVFHFEEGAQVPGRVEELDLKAFVSKSHLAADKQHRHVRHFSCRCKPLLQVCVTRL